MLFFPREVCVTKLSILDILEGPGNFISPVCLLSLNDVVMLFIYGLSEGCRLGLAGTCMRCVTALPLEDGSRGWAGSRETAFCFESRLLQGTVLRRRTGNWIPSCKDVRRFSALLSLLQLCHREALSVMGVGMENSFSFAFINNHVEA